MGVHCWFWWQGTFFMRGCAERGGWVSIVGSGGKELFSCVGVQSVVDGCPLLVLVARNFFHAWVCRAWWMGVHCWFWWQGTFFMRGCAERGGWVSIVGSGG